MVRRSLALAHGDVETRKAPSLHVEARILSNQPYFISVLGNFEKREREGYLMPRLREIGSHNVRPWYVRLVAK
jgi:hypothetical protein